MKTLKKTPKIPMVEVQDPLSALAVWDNVLINGDTNLTAEEFKIVMFLTSHIDSRKTKKLGTFVFQTADFVNAIGLGSGNSSYFEKVMKNLHKKRIIVEDLVENSVAGMHWIDYFKIIRAFRTYDTSLGTLLINREERERYLQSREMQKMIGTTEVRLGKELAQFLLHLKKNFTEIELRYILKMKSVYSMRIFPLCKQFLSTGERTITLARLRQMLMLDDKYLDWKDFKKRILVPAITEIREVVGWNIDYMARSYVKGQPYQEITFYFHEELKSNVSAKTTPTKMTLEEREVRSREIEIRIREIDKDMFERGRELLKALSPESRREYEVAAQATLFPNDDSTDKRGVRDYIVSLRSERTTKDGRTYAHYSDATLQRLADERAELKREESLL